MKPHKEARKEQRRRDMISSTGRTVEEVVMRRKLEEMAIKGSTSMSNLAINKRPGSFLPAIGSGNHTSAMSSPNTFVGMEENNKVYSEGDVRSMMEEVMKYCRALQHRVQVILSYIKLLLDCFSLIFGVFLIGFGGASHPTTITRFNDQSR